MFANSDIDAIFCARGGYGANRVLPLLDYNLIKENPKIFIGYSDITALLTSITQKTSMVTFHGPMLTTYKDSWVEYNYSLMQRVLSGEKFIKIYSPDGLETKILKHGIAHGPLWGGNMCLLINRLGTNESLNTDGVILFLEDILWFIFNPHFTIKKYLKKDIWWHSKQPWYFGMPLHNYIISIIVLIISIFV